MKSITLGAMLAMAALTALPALAQQQQISPPMQDAIRQRMQDRMRETDVDADGTISHAEFMNQAETRFKTADLNGDKKITQDEFATLRQKMMQQALQQRNAAAGGK